MNRISFVWALVFYLFGGGYVDVAEGSYLAFGCWRDTPRRAVPTLEGTDARLDDNYKTRTDAIQKCYEVAKERGYEWFAVQHGGWCASSANAARRVRMYGPSRACRNGKGGSWASNIYMIVKPDGLCERGGYKKAGCFTRDSKLFSELLVQDLEPTQHNWGEAIDWNNFQKSLRSLVCRCEEKARDKKFSYFAIGFYGECWAGSNMQALDEKLLAPGSHESHTCVGGDDFSVCNDKGRDECAGTDNNEYVYLITEDETPTTPPPVPKTWKDYPYSMYKDKECKAMNWEPQGCYDTVERGDLLVYWRYEIEWDADRMPIFASSFVCACAEAAKAANVKYFGTHYWGECWALELSQVTAVKNGDCTLADGKYETKCKGDKRYNFECLGDKNYYMYSVL